MKVHLEFEGLLERALRESAWETLPGAPSYELIQSLLERLRVRIEVSDPPSEIEEKITTNAAFVLAAALKRIPEHGLITPQQVAELLEGLLCGAEEPLFETSIGGLGHINADPTTGFVNRWLTALEESPFGLSTASRLVVDPPQTAVPWPALTVHREQLLERARRSDNPDVAELLRAKPQLAHEDCLMLLALLGDSELEVRPYLHGVGGRQNIPWLINRFLKDAQAFSEGAAHSEPQRLKAVEGRRERALEEWLQQLLQLRAARVLSEKQERPELYMHRVLLMIRGFYAFYNLPDSRALELPEDSLARRLTKLTLELVSRVAGELENSCRV